MKQRMSERDIPEVAAFMESAAKIDRLKEAYPEVFEQLTSLAEEYNNNLEAADKAVRGQGTSCGPFTMMSSSTKFNADKLYEGLGRERFLEVGGVVTTKTVYDVDKARLEAAIAAGALPTEVVEQVRIISPRYKKPEGINIG